MATPYMGLILPVPTVTPGPLYAFQEVTAFTTIDAHDHTPGKGPQVPTMGISIDADLSFQSFNATLLRTTRFDDLPSPPALGTDLSALSSVNGDLYYNNGVGFPIQITAGSGLNATSIGGIGGDYATSPASVFYTQISTTFTFWQNTNQSAQLDIGSLTIRKMTPASPGITITAPVGLAGSYGIVLPLANPASTKLVGWSATGQLLPAYDVDNSSIEFNGSLNLQVKALGITAAMLVNNIVLNGDISTTGNFTVGNTETDALFIGGPSGAILANSTTAFGGIGGLMLTNQDLFAPAGAANAALRSLNSNTLSVVDTAGVNWAILTTEDAVASAMVRGVVDGAGNPVGGGPFTSSRLALGSYQVSFNTNFAAPPAVVVTSYGGVNTVAVVNGGPLVGQFFIHTFTTLTAPGAFADIAFSFTAVGLR